MCFRGLFLSGSLGMFLDVPPKKLRWLAGKFSMNEHVFPIEKLGDVPAIVVLAFTQGCISLVVFWIRDEIQVEGRLSCPVVSNESFYGRCSKIDTLLESSQQPKWTTQILFAKVGRAAEIIWRKSLGSSNNGKIWGVGVRFIASNTKGPLAHALLFGVRRIACSDVLTLSSLGKWAKLTT